MPAVTQFNGKSKAECRDTRLPMDIGEPVMGMALVKPLVALAGLSHRPPQHGLGVTREPQQTGNSDREGSLPFA